MANIPGEIVWQANNNTWFTNNAGEVYPDGITIYHVDGRYKFTDGVTTLGALPFRGDGGTETQNLQDVTDNGANTTNQMQINGVNVATVNDIPSLSGYVDTAGLTTNTIPKATASDTIGDSSITDDGTTVTVNSPTVITSDNSNNQIISIDSLKALVTHDVKVAFNSPIYSFANMQANETVETDASKNLVSAAKGTAYNKDFGTAAGTVLEGNRITQTITNGVTDKVPSEDAVFDALALKLTQNNFTDITGSCTILGWISFSVNKIKAIDMGSYYIVNGQVAGTSNSSTTQVVLPFTNNGVQLDDCRFAINNGTNIFARCFVGNGSNTVDFRATATGSTFSSAGTKAIYFTIVVEK